MKIVFNNSTLQFNRRDYDWEQISVDSSMFTKGWGILVGLKNPNNRYYGCATQSGVSCCNSGVNAYIDVSNYKKLKFPIRNSLSSISEYTPGFCLYDDYTDVTYFEGNTVRQHIVASNCYEGTGQVQTIIIDVPATAKALRFTLPKDWIDTNPINVYGVLKDNS